MPKVHANGIDIHYIEAGQGTPVILLDNAMVSTNPVWEGHPSAYLSHVGAFAQRFRVIVPDTRGSGRTVHSGGPIPHTLLADDVAALIDALALDQPGLCGFSDGGEVATIVGIRHPDAASAIVNHEGYDLFNPDPDSPALVLTRQMLGGARDATRPNFDAIARIDQMRTMVDNMQADHDAAQGPGHWKTVVEQTYERISKPHGYTLADLEQITTPALVLIGDRDPFCTPEDGAAVFRALPSGELAVVPDTGHQITTAMVASTIDFLARRLDS